MSLRTLIAIRQPPEIEAGEYEFIGRLAEDPDLEAIRISGAVFLHSRTEGVWYSAALLPASLLSLEEHQSDG